MTKATDEQLRIIEHGDGHAMVSAAPGSGKTTTMSEYVVSLLNNGMSPSDILVLMFNKSTQLDFVGKLASKGVQSANDMAIRTYHSLALNLLRFFNKKGLIDNFQVEAREWVLRSAAQDSLMKAFGQREFYSRKTELIDNFLSLVDYHKSGFLSEREAFKELGFRGEDARLLDAYENFETVRKNSNTLYFSDFLTNAVYTLRSSERARKYASNLKERIIVDEFQDTNPMQYEFVKLLAGERGQLMVVGDIDQSIYDWRGADPELMRTQFSEDFKGVTTYTLSKTFRYGPQLAALSKNLIANNKARFEQFCESFDVNQTMDINIQSAPEISEPEVVVSYVKDQLKRGRKYEDMAVLCRTYGSVGGVEMELLTQGVPAIMPKESSILSSREMNAMLAITRIARVFETYSDVKTAWTQVISECPDDIKTVVDNSDLVYLGAHLRDQVFQAFVDNNPEFLSFDQYVRSPAFKNSQVHTNLVKAGKIDNLKDTATTFSHSFQFSGAARSLNKQIERILRGCNVMKHLEAKTMTAADVDTCKRRVEAIKRYIEYHDLDSQCFLEGIDNLRAQQEKTSEVTEGVLITSIHKAKGLEWPVVIMPSMVKGLYPFETDKVTATPAQVESERRLAYVGITRSSDELLLTCPQDPSLDRFMSSGGASSPKPNSSVSPFLYEMLKDSKDLGVKYIPFHERKDSNEPELSEIM